MLAKAMIVGAGLLLAVPAAPALADDSPETETKGSCSAGAFWEMQVEPEDGALKVQFEVKSATPGQAWDYSISGPSGVLASGSDTADSRGKVEVETQVDGALGDTLTAVATSAAGQVCDSTVGILADDDSDDQGEDSDDQGDDDAYEGTCTDDSTIAMTVKKAGKTRIAKVSLTSARKGEKWRYTIHRGSKVIYKGSAKTRGKKASFKITKKARGKGLLTASAVRAADNEQCEVDDDLNEDLNDD